MNFDPCVVQKYVFLHRHYITLRIVAKRPQVSHMISQWMDAWVYRGLGRGLPLTLPNVRQWTRPTPQARSWSWCLARSANGGSLQKISQSRILSMNTVQILGPGVHFGINSWNFAHWVLEIYFAIFFGGGQKSFNTRGLICINPRWPPSDLPLITLCLITLEQMTAQTCINMSE